MARLPVPRMEAALRRGRLVRSCPESAGPIGEAGAAEVVACDCDPLALAATAANARLNGVTLTLADDYRAVAGALDLIVVADVLYDRANLHWLTQFAGRAPRVLVGDSRVKDFALPPYRQIARATAATVPDLDESAEFRDVRLYMAG